MSFYSSIGGSMGRQFSPFIVIGLVAAAVGFSGCTRKGEMGSALTLSLPQTYIVQGQRVATNRTLSSKVSTSTAVFLPMHIRINIHSSAGGGGIVDGWAWDACDGYCGDDAYTPPPTSINMQVPNGKGRLIQYMAAGQMLNPTTGEFEESMVFTYDDEVIDLNGGSKSVTLLPAAIGNGGAEYSLSGQYVDAGGNTPTGPVMMYIQPVVGRPKMLIQQDYMFGGWVNLFFVEGANFSYYLPEQGLPLFGGGNVTSALMDSQLGQNLAKIQMPAFSRQRDSTAFMESGGVGYYGFFGPGAAGATPAKYACADGSAGNIPNVGDSVVSNAISGSIYWDTSGILVANEAGDIRTSGRVDTVTNVTPCSTGAFDSHVKIMKTALSNGLHDLLQTRGPFYKTNINSDTIQKTISGGNATLTWAYLPSALAHLTGVRVYYKDMGAAPTDATYSDFRMPAGDAVSCRKVEMSGGWSSIDVAAPTASQVISGGTNNHAFVVCPMTSAGVLDYGLYPYPSYSSGGSSILITHDGNAINSVTAGTNYHTVQLSLVDGSGNPLPSASIPTFTLNINRSGTPTVYVSESSGALNVDVTSYSWPAAQQTKTFYVSNTSPAMYGQQMLSFSGGMFQSASVNLDFAQLTTESMITLNQIPNATAFGTCYPASVTRKFSTSPSMSATPRTVTLDSTTTGSFDFYSTKDCSGTAITSVTIQANASSAHFYFKSTGSTGSATIDATSSGSMNTASPSISIGSASHAGFRAEPADGQWNIGGCDEIVLKPVNSVGADVPLPNTGTTTITYSGTPVANFYGSDNTCAAGATSSIATSFTATGTGLNGYYMQFTGTSGGGTLSFSGYGAYGITIWP